MGRFEFQICSKSVWISFELCDIFFCYNNVSQLIFKILFQSMWRISLSKQLIRITLQIRSSYTRYQHLYLSLSLLVFFKADTTALWIFKWIKMRLLKSVEEKEKSGYFFLYICIKLQVKIAEVERLKKNRKISSWKFTVKSSSLLHRTFCQTLVRY